MALKFGYILIFLLWVFSIGLKGQSFDSNWLLGRTKIDFPTPYDSSYTIKFSENGNFTITQIDRNPRFSNTSINLSMSNKNGDLLFYSNGLVFFDSINQVMKIGNNDAELDIGFGRVFPQAVLILPDSENSHFFHIIHGKSTFFKSFNPDNKYDFEGIGELFYSSIDMGNQNGEFVELNTQILNDTFLKTGFTTTRHGNGKDWWVVGCKGHSNKIHSFLISTGGVSEEKIHVVADTLSPGSGFAIFSPNGEYYARYLRKVGYKENEDTSIPYQMILELYDFDRCTGTISNQRVFEMDTIVQNMGINNTYPGCSFSPNSQFLYFTNGRKVFQVDTRAPDIISSKIMIGEFESSVNDSLVRKNINLNNFQLAPNGEILITENSSYLRAELHAIKNPNEKGVASNFQKDAILFDWSSRLPLPIFPNYNLMEWKNSPCDTLSASYNIPEQNLTVEISPNPASQFFIIQFSETLKNDVKIQIYAITGHLIDEQKISRGVKSERITCSTLDAGFYNIVILSEGYLTDNKKLLIIK